MEPGLDFFATLYGKLSLGGIIAVIIWKVYHDMKQDKTDLVAKVNQVEKKHDMFVTATHERTLKALEDNASSRTKLVSAIDRLDKTCIGMSGALETLPCNQVSPRKWVTPAHGTQTPPKGNQT